MSYYKIFFFAGLAALVSASTIPPTEISVTENVTVDDCNDVDGNCWTRPDQDCFGVYEPWSRAHCPLRCGYCEGKPPPCEDINEYCELYEQSTCSEPQFLIWARTNCRKHCNLCFVTPEPGENAQTTGPGEFRSTSSVPGSGSGNGGPSTVRSDNSGSGNATSQAEPETPPPNVPVTIPGTVAVGHQDTIITQTPGSATEGMCLYHGTEHKEGERWNDGCAYECTCSSSATNRVTCMERCSRWELTDNLTGCKLVKEENECCERLECNSS